MTKPQAASYDNVAQMLHDMLLSEYTSIKLIICTKRETFLKQALACPDSIVRSDIGNSPDENGVPLAEHTPDKAISPFTSTLGTIAGARKIRMAYCPSIDSLRAYLSTLSYSPHSEQLRDSRNSLLHVIDALSLHFGTSEFSAQGLSRTLALAVEVAARLKMPLVFSEVGDPHHPGSAYRGSKLWNAEVSLLSDSVRLGAGSDSWTRTSIPVKSVARRWFHFSESIEKGSAGANTEHHANSS